MSALGGFGSYYFGKLEERENTRQSDEAQDDLKKQIEELKAQASQIAANTVLIYQALKVEMEIWTEVEMKNVPPGITDYLLLLFTSDKGRISGKVRMKGSDVVSAFSSTANNRVPVAVRNLWVPKEGQYKVPTIMEFTVTEKTEPDASLSIYTQGFIFSRGQETH